jgi:hypothetical protein
MCCASRQPEDPRHACPQSLAWQAIPASYCGKLSELTGSRAQSRTMWVDRKSACGSPLGKPTLRAHNSAPGPIDSLAGSIIDSEVAPQTSSCSNLPFLTTKTEIALRAPSQGPSLGIAVTFSAPTMFSTRSSLSGTSRFQVLDLGLKLLVLFGQRVARSCHCF